MRDEGDAQYVTVLTRTAKGAPEDVLALAQSLAEGAPASSKYKYALARVLWKLGRYRAALALLEARLQSDGSSYDDRPLATECACELRWRTRWREEARALIELAHDRASSCLWQYRLLASEQTDLDFDLLNHLVRGVKLDPNHAGICSELGWVLHLIGEYREHSLGNSEEWLRRAALLAPDEDEHLGRLAVVRTARGEAVDLTPLMRLAQARPSSGATRYLAAILVGRGELEAGIHWFRRALVGRLEDIDAMVGLADALSQYGEHGEARSMAEQATRLSPEHADAWRALGEACALAGDNENAVVALTHAHELGVSATGGG